MRGKFRKISLPRRLIADLMHASSGVPFVSLSRRFNLAPLIEARALNPTAAGWAAIFVKAFSLVAREQPILRTVRARWPWPGFYELPKSIAMITIARVEDGENCVMPQRITAPDLMTLPEVNAEIRLAKDALIKDVPAFRKIMLVTRLPLPLRRLVWLIGLNFGRQRANYFGSFLVTSVAAFGGGELHALSPGPFILSYGVAEPDQTMDVMLRWDHRITDGAQIAKTLTRLEEVLNSEISVELRGLRPQAEPKPIRAAAS